MQAYATSERLSLGDELRTLDRTSVRTATAADSNGTLFDHILGRLADLVVDRLMERSETQRSEHVSAWLDARGAAEYLGVHRDTLRKLAAQRAIPTHQDGPGCKLYFRRDELDEWRRSARPVRSAAALRAIS
ncbi:MAG TPA: helix-turn-helix domain-containing protein [Solirubrobacteraceae bacterium]|nr:helix-turn-helix domain-containing protein [Solirubrobacteraceae bacterium]